MTDGRSILIGGLCSCALLAASCTTDVLGPDVEDVHLTLTVSKSEMIVGDTVELRVVGRNPTRRTLRFTTHACAAFRFRILYTADLVVFRYPTVCNDIGATRVLEPGDSIVETALFDGMASAGPFRDENGQRTTLTLTTGRYTVVAAPEGATDNQSNEVELRIRRRTLSDPP